MAAWDDASKARAVKLYTEAKPTPETSPEIIKEIAEELDQTSNGVRMILVQAGVYVKKAPTSSSAGKTKEGTTRISKETLIGNLKDIIKDLGLEPNDEILDKLTGKAAEYFADVIKHALSNEE
jgi:hypothetical protein